MFAAPLNKVGVLYPYGETLFPDANGLHHPSIPQLVRHIVYVKDAGNLTEDTGGTVHGHTLSADVKTLVKHQCKVSGATLM